MPKNIVKRIGRIINHNMKLLIGNIETAEAQTTIFKALSETNTAIDVIKTEMGRNKATELIADRQLQKAKQNHQLLDLQVRSALKKNNETNAVAAISRQIDIETQFSVLTTTICHCAEHHKELENRLIALQDKKQQLADAIRQNADEHTLQNTRLPGATNHSHLNVERRLERNIEKTPMTFDRVFAQFDSAMTTLEGGSKHFNSLAELENLSRTAQIEERLAAFKRQQAKDV